MKYVYLLTENSLVKVGVLRKIFIFLEIAYIRITGESGGIDNTAAAGVDDVNPVDECVERPL